MNNTIMVDAEAMAPAEGSANGQLLNEALLYHELLHAQLGIESLDDADVVSDVCQCAVANPAARSDAGHTTIPDLQTGYLVTAGGARGANVQVIQVQTPTGGNSPVVIQIPVAKASYTIDGYVPENGNVDSLKFGAIANGKVPATVWLTDPGQAGKLVVMVDPPMLWEYFFIELTPGPTPARPVSWGRVKVRYR